jgi:hypothetical protein
MTWTPIFDRAPALGVGEPGAITIDPFDSDILYVGTSNRDGSQFSGDATQPAAGLFKSTDGGASWLRLGSSYPSNIPSNASIFFNQVINVVIIDPANSQIIYLASNSGLFVSKDGGFNWTKGAAPAGDVGSLQLDASSPPAARILYAGITGCGAQSTDGGLSWAVILSGATPVVANALCPTPLASLPAALASSSSRWHRRPLAHLRSPQGILHLRLPLEFPFHVADDKFPVDLAQAILFVPLITFR